MIVTVSTVKTSLAGVQRFVEGNLAGGADHLVVFLDEADAEVEGWLAGRSEVTVVVTDDAWWGGDRPRRINKRQRINANVARSVLALTDWAAWLFHVDSDEVVRIDRAQLDGVPAHKRAVSLRPLEVVSVREPDGEPTLFKRLLEPGELNLLTVLGALPEPSNSLYFRSHIAGKVGIRPALDIWLGIHKATTREEDRVGLARRPGLAMLHYESYSGDEFVRKWLAMVGSGTDLKLSFGEHRQKLADAMVTLLGMDLDPQAATRQLGAIYERHMADPVDVLDDLGFLERVDARSGGHVPEPLPPGEADLLASRLEALAGAPMADFLPETEGADVAALLRSRLGDLGEHGPDGGSARGRGLKGLLRRP